MSVHAVLFDLGGVIVRTEYQAPREHLAERLNVSYEELVQLVFESESARKASLGQITSQQHWELVTARLNRPASEAAELRDEFFGGDVLDRDLLDYIRSLRPARRTGLISNAWPDMREYITRNHFADAFDAILISAEVGMLKPDRRIFELALNQLRVGPEEAVLVDDTIANVEGARAIGMSAVHFRTREQARQELSQLLV